MWGEKIKKKGKGEHEKGKKNPKNGLKTHLQGLKTQKKIAGGHLPPPPLYPPAAGVASPLPSRQRSSGKKIMC